MHWGGMKRRRRIKVEAQALRREVLGDKRPHTAWRISHGHTMHWGDFPCRRPPNSEVSDHFLLICAGAPAAVNDMQFALQKDEYGSYPKDSVSESTQLQTIRTTM
jgi:hypothetical protein